MFRRYTIVILVIVLLSVAGFWVVTTQRGSRNRTIDWQTYRSEEFGFEVKYPEETDIEEQQPLIYSAFDVQAPANDFRLSIHKGRVHSDSFLWTEVYVTSRDFKIREARDWDFGPVHSVEQWDREQKFLLESAPGTKCSHLLSLERELVLSPTCRMIKLNGIKMLDRGHLWPFEINPETPVRLLTFYANNLRYDFVVSSSEIAFEYNSSVGYQFSFDTFDNFSQGSLLELSNQILSTFQFIE